MMAHLPTGNVTFLFSDVEGSTRLLEEDAAGLGRSLQRHHQLLREAVERYGGIVFETVGDAMYAAFAVPSDAVRAAIDAQRGLLTEPWSAPGAIRARMALHTGEVQPGDGAHYFGPPLFRAARL